MKELLEQIGKNAKKAGNVLATASTEQKNKALLYCAKQIRESVDLILDANQKDIQALPPTTSNAMRDRLLLNNERIEAMAKGIEEIADLPDPIGKILHTTTRPNGLLISKISTPLGVIGVIYESRPNVTADAGALCFKAGNAVILRGGSDSFNSSKIITDLMHKGLEQASLPKDCIQTIPSTSREAVACMLKLDTYIDVIVPRGGKSLIERITNESRIPLFKHLNGICHIYIDSDADLKMVKDVVLNSKLRRTGTCNSAETILIHKQSPHLPALLDVLFDAKCEVRGDEDVQKHDPRVKHALQEDWDTEYLDAIVSIKVVTRIDDAIEHIACHSSHHTESIITNNALNAEKFLNEVDSAVVMHNASTQFCDGGEFGMGAEIGIATGRLHARGPIGLEQLTIFKYQVRGNGQIRP